MNDAIELKTIFWMCFGTCPRSISYAMLKVYLQRDSRNKSINKFG